MIDKRIKIAAAIAILVVAIGVAGIAVKNKSTIQEEVITKKNIASTQKEVETIKVGGYPAPINGLIAPMVAEELGYYDGIKIENAYLASGPESLAAIATGHIDAAHVPYTTIVRAVAKGAKVKVVVSAHGSPSKFSGVWVLADSPIRSAKDLKGKKIGGGAGQITPGNSPYILLIGYLKTVGLSIDDVNVVDIPRGQEEQVLKNKQIDAVWIYNKISLGRSIDNGEVRQLFSSDDIIDSWHHCGILVSEKFIKENPETLKKFVEGFVKGAEWERDNPDKAKELHITKGENPGQVRKYYEPSTIGKHALVDERNIQVIIDHFVDTGELKEGQIKPSDIYTNEFNPYYKS